MAYQVKTDRLNPVRRPKLGVGDDEGAPSIGSEAGAASKPVSTGGSGRFVNLQRYMNANADVSAREGAKVAGRVEQAGAAAENAVKGYETAGVAGPNPYKPGSTLDEVGTPAPTAPAPTAADAKAKVEQANSQVNAARGNTSNQTALFGAASPFNAALMREPVGARLHNAGQRYSGLSQMLSTAQGNVATADAARTAADTAAQGLAATQASEAAAAADAKKQADADAQAAMADEEAAFHALYDSGKVANTYFGHDGAKQLAARARVDGQFGPGTYDKLLRAYLRRVQAGRAVSYD